MGCLQALPSLTSRVTTAAIASNAFEGAQNSLQENLQTVVPTLWDTTRINSNESALLRGFVTLQRKNYIPRILVRKGAKAARVSLLQQLRLAGFAFKHFHWQALHLHWQIGSRWLACSTTAASPWVRSFFSAIKAPAFCRQRTNKNL